MFRAPPPPLMSDGVCTIDATTQQCPHPHKTRLRQSEVAPLQRARHHRIRHTYELRCLRHAVVCRDVTQPLQQRFGLGTERTQRVDDEWYDATVLVLFRQLLVLGPLVSCSRALMSRCSPSEL